MENLNNLELEIENSGEEERKYVVFKLADEYYGLDINNVKSIEKAQSFTRVPNANRYIKGVMNLRGEVVPVIELRKRFGLKAKEGDTNSRIIIVMVHDIQVGLLVDSSSEVITFDKEDIESTQAMKDSSVEDFVKYIGKKGNRLIILIDLVKVVGYDTDK